MSCDKSLKTRNIIKAALAEDIGKGDITTKLLFPKGKKVQAVILAGEAGIICGINIARLVFKLENNNIRFTPAVKDGDRVKRGQILIKIYGKASSILSVERVALNFLGLLSGIATRTGQFINKIRNYRVKIMDTRKTLPGLRDLEKYAVKVGGGYNHRFRLHEMVLIKDNHIRAGVMGLGDLIKRIRKKILPEMKIEIEVKNLKEFKLALKAEPDIIMLDNMSVGQVKRVINLRNNLKPKTKNLKPKIETSGNINLKNICAYAQTGVDFISLGTLTKDVRCLDLSLEIIKRGGEK